MTTSTSNHPFLPQSSLLCEHPDIGKGYCIQLALTRLDYKAAIMVSKAKGHNHVRTSKEAAAEKEIKRKNIKAKHEVSMT
ncbi:hypothetical protein ACTXT7_003356 [Hymenolepis weldensis]